MLLGFSYSVAYACDDEGADGESERGRGDIHGRGGGLGAAGASAGRVDQQVSGRGDDAARQVALESAHITGTEAAAAVLAEPELEPELEPEAEPERR